MAEYCKRFVDNEFLYGNKVISFKIEAAIDVETEEDFEKASLKYMNKKYGVPIFEKALRIESYV